MKIFTKSSVKIERNALKANKVKTKMAGCFEFRHKTGSFEFPSALMQTPTSGLGKFGKMLRSRSDPDVSPSKKQSSESPKLSPKSSPSVNAPKRRFVRVVRGNNQSDQYFNPHVKRKISDPNQPKKRDLEALNRRYFSDSDSDSDTQIKKDRDFPRSKSEERSVSPSIPIHSLLKKNLSLDVEMGTSRHTRFKDQVDIIGIDKKGKQIYTALGKIQFDNFETCDIRNEEDLCPIVEPEVLDPISETPELAKSPPRLITFDKVMQTEVSKDDSVNNKAEPEHADSEDDGKTCEDNKPETVDFSLSDAESDKTSQETCSEIRPRTSSLDIHDYQKPLRFIGRLFRSTSDSIMKIGSPRGSPDQVRKKHRYVRVLRDTDHGDEYHNPYVIRKNSSQDHTITGSVDNINERLRPILRKQNSLDLSTSPGRHAEVHAHFKESVEVVEFTKKTKCVNLIDEKRMQEGHLKSDDETDSIDESVTSDDVFHDKRPSDVRNLDPGVGSDDSFDETSKSENDTISSSEVVKSDLASV